MRKNSIKLGLVKKAIKNIGSGTLGEITRELDKIAPEYAGRRRWEEKEVRFLLSSENWVVEDVDNPGTFVFASNDRDRDFFQTPRYWDT